MGGRAKTGRIHAPPKRGEAKSPLPRKRREENRDKLRRGDRRRDDRRNDRRPDRQRTENIRYRRNSRPRSSRGECPTPKNPHTPSRPGPGRVCLEWVFSPNCPPPGTPRASLGSADDRMRVDLPMAEIESE